MARSLVIVESPAKARTINRYLGRDYVVKSSVGHIRDLPVGSGRARDPGALAQARARARAEEAARPPRSAQQKARERSAKARAQLVARMGVDPDHDWAAHYEVLPGKEKVVEDLKRAASGAEFVYLATDLDREGEAIAWHLMQTIGGDPARYRRVVFNEITRRAIQEAFEKPASVDENRVNAQQARRFLDRVVGFELSPLLWAKVARGLSAGRVQSVAVRLIVEREREIRAFRPEEYWEVFAQLRRARDAGAGDDAPAARFQVVRDRGEAFRPGDRATVDAALARLSGQPLRVGARDDRPTTTRPPAPFITSTLQQAASSRLGFGVRKTMTLAQRLYEAGHITYMRTDSTNLSREAVDGVRDFIRDSFGKRYVPEQPNVYASKETAQEAHEAIRPSNVALLPERLDEADRDLVRLYELIWRQFVACQMPRAEYLSTTLTVTAGDFELRARGRIPRFDGFTRVLAPPQRGDDDTALPDFAVGEDLQAPGGFEPVQHFTKPPARYGEASLVRELERRGIGRPSTYAAIISTIQERGYVRLESRRFHAEKIGELVTDRLVECFENLMGYDFTARLEDELDEVASGNARWKNVLNAFYRDFSAKLRQAQSPTGGMRANQPTTLAGIDCEKCGRPMQLRTASTGVFLGCSGYALPPKERCTFTMNLAPADEAVAAVPDVLPEAAPDADAGAEPEGDEGESRLLLEKERCPLCATPMTSYILDAKRKLHVCGNSPDCAGFRVETGTFRLKGYDGPTLACDRCGAVMRLRTGRFGRFFGCTNEACRNTRRVLRNGQPAPPRVDPVPMPELRCARVDDHYVLRDGASGLFLAASQFPKHRETRAPTVAELAPHREQLAEKYRHLADGPRSDADGNAAIVRFSRKTGEHYLASEVDGKQTGWRAFFRDGAWQVVQGGSDDTGERRVARAAGGRAGAGRGARAGARRR
jgi:DNA topoisomerase-1